MLHSGKSMEAASAARSNESADYARPSKERLNQTRSNAPVDQTSNESRACAEDCDTRETINAILMSNIIPSLISNHQQRQRGHQSGDRQPSGKPGATVTRYSADPQGIIRPDSWNGKARAFSTNQLSHPSLPIDALIIEQFVVSLMDGDYSAAASLFEDLRQAGYTWEELATGLALPASAQMGALWAEDAASFASVSLGTSLIHRIINQDFQRSFSAAPTARTVGSVAVATMPDEQHILSATITERLFERRNWHVQSAITAREDELIALVKSCSLDILCFAFIRDQDWSEVAEMLARVRQASMNDSLKIIIGGYQVATVNGLVATIGADAAAKDFESAIELAFSMNEADKPANSDWRD